MKKKKCYVKIPIKVLGFPASVIMDEAEVKKRLEWAGSHPLTMCYLNDDSNDDYPKQGVI